MHTVLVVLGLVRSGPAIDAMMDGDKRWSINSVPRLERALIRVAEYVEQELLMKAKP